MLEKLEIPVTQILLLHMVCLYKNITYPHKYVLPLCIRKNFLKGAKLSSSIERTTNLCNTSNTVGLDSFRDKDFWVYMKLGFLYWHCKWIYLCYHLYLNSLILPLSLCFPFCQEDSLSITHTS